MHSLPSRRRLPQPNFFRFKCYRLSPVPFSRPTPSLPAPAAPLPGLLPAAHLPFGTSPLVSASACTLTHALNSAAVCQQTRGPPHARSKAPPRTPGTVQQADAQPVGAVGRQGRRTLSQSANGDPVMAVVCSHQQPPHSSASSRAVTIILIS